MRKRVPPNPAVGVPRKWLSISEALWFMGQMGKDKFLKLAQEHNLSVSMIGSVRHYNVDELNKIFERNKIIYNESHLRN